MRLSVKKGWVELVDAGVFFLIRITFVSLITPQIGCTAYATYALADGVLYVSGKNDDCSAGLGHQQPILVPTAMDFGNRRYVAISVK